MSKIEKLEAQMKENKEKLRATMLQSCALDQEFRDLCAEEHQPFLPGVRLLEISRRKAAIGSDLAQLKDQQRDLAAKAHGAELAYFAAQRRLKEAKRVVRVIENPPPWGLGDYSPDDIRAFRRQAEKTIQQLA